MPLAVAVYVSPGWHQFKAVTWEIFNYLYSGVLRPAVVYLLGSGGHNAVQEWCEGKPPLIFQHLPAVPTPLGLKALRINILLAFTKDKGVVYRYADKVEAEGIDVMVKRLGLHTH